VTETIYTWYGSRLNYMKSFRAHPHSSLTPLVYRGG